MALTPEQVQFFRHNGFLKLPARLPQQFVASLKDLIWRRIREEVAPVVHDRQGRVVRLSNIWQRGDFFSEAITRPEVIDPLESLIGPNIELILNRHNHATLRLAEDGSSYLHRDVLQWCRTIVTVLFYLEETTVENGCTVVVPGSHLLPAASRLELGDDPAMKASGILDQTVPVPMPAGGLLVIDSFLIHGPGENTTPHSRMSMTVGYHSVDELLGMENPRRVLIRGERPYLGNDK